MKTTKTGYRFNKNGKPILSLPNHHKLIDEYKGQSFKEEGLYWFYVRKQGNGFVYQL